VELLGEGADLGVRQRLRRAVGVLAGRVIVQHDHRQARPVAGLVVLEHLLIHWTADRRRFELQAPVPHQDRGAGTYTKS